MNLKPAPVLAAAAALGAISATTAWVGGAALSSADAAPAPSHFDHPQQNPYFPLVPGTVSRYRGSDDGVRYRERVVITHRTKRIQGVDTRVVSDVTHRADGSLAEKTRDWYAADDDGTVWYFGEATATYDRHGRVESRDGSWQAGEHGARAGIIMPADPRPTDAYRQEYERGDAEDQAWIVQNNATTSVPHGTFHRVVRSFEWSRLEKNVVSLKFYAPGLGIVRERDVAGGNERFVLVSVRHR
jgi:hypothetical protein